MPRGARVALSVTLYMEVMAVRPIGPNSPASQDLAALFLSLHL